MILCELFYSVPGLSLCLFFCHVAPESKDLMFMETSALDSTNVEAAFNDVLSGSSVSTPKHLHLLVSSLTDLLTLTTSSHPNQGGQQAGDPRLHQRRDPVQPHRSHRRPGEEGGLLQELLTDHCRFWIGSWDTQVKLQGQKHTHKNQVSTLIIHMDSFSTNKGTI